MRGSKTSRYRACGSYRVFIKYCVFSEDFKIFLTLAFLCFRFVSVRVHCTHTRQVEQYSRTVKSSEKSQNFKEKTICNEHPVPNSEVRKKGTVPL